MSAADMAASHTTTAHRRRAPRTARVLAVVVGTALGGCGTGLPLGQGPAPTPSTSATGSPQDRDGDVTAPDTGTEPTASPTRAPTTTPVPTPTPTPTRAPTPAPTATPTATPGPSPTPAPETPTVAPEPAPEPRPSALRRGDEGPAVLALQRSLAELGYFLTVADGRFGPGTEQAVWALQKAAGLRRDGLVGPATQAAVDAGTRPTARSTTGRVIEVDLDRQLLLAVDDGVVTRVVNASSGNGETYVALGRTQRAITPTGDYTVVRQIDALHESTLGLGTMYRPKYFRGGWAVHGSGSIPPWPASHGCVRVSNAAMNWIWDSWGAPLGTRVLVY